VRALPGSRLEWTSPLGAVYTTDPPDPGDEAFTRHRPLAEARDDNHDDDPPPGPYLDPDRYIDPQDWLDRDLEGLLDETLLDWFDESAALQSRCGSPLAAAGAT
jgi:hypothetical protein